MSSNRKLSDEEVQFISWRMKSVRMLTGLTQESFAAENGVSLTSLKCWEIGRAIPRKEGASSYVNAMKKRGIDISLDWIFYGSGPGPTYLNGTQIPKSQADISYIEQQINLFKKYQLSKGLNPIVTNVQDDAMLPLFKNGDYVGGYYISINDIRSNFKLSEIIETPWLLNVNSINFIPRFLVLGEEDKYLFYCSKTDLAIKSEPILAIGRICWHYTNT